MPSDATSFLVTCTENEDGDLILPFPDDLLDTLGWTEGTLLDFQAVAGKITIREVEGGDSTD